MSTQQPPPNVPPMQQKEVVAAINLLSLINKLNLKIFSTKTRKGLIFTILNDTAQVLRYDRAVLWSFEEESPKMLGVSGQSVLKSTTETAKKWRDVVEDIKEPDKPKILTQDDLSESKRTFLEITEQDPKPAVLWIPIYVNQELKLGLWLEKWNHGTWAKQEEEILTHLSQAYGIAWEKFLPKYSFSMLRNKRFLITALIATLLLLSLRIPLRVVAPSEVVPKDPILITAPIEDIIAKIDVKPGQHVKEGDVLFEYDKRISLENLKAAEEQRQVALRDLNRAKTLAFSDPKSLTEISVLEAKLKKEEVNLNLAKYHASQLVVKSPQDGIVMLDDPEQWQGKPVHVGEKILMITNPKKTKVRIWIPESDNIPLDPKVPIKVVLNIDPGTTYEAKLDYISNASTINEKQHIASFIAEADWTEPVEAKIGLKGISILYGENVSLFYWLTRKPINYFRNLIGA